MAKQELRQRSRVCKWCQKTFHYSPGPGRDRVHCAVECREDYQRSRRTPKEKWPLCASDGCAYRVRAQHSTQCNRCYTASLKRRASICAVHKCTRPATRVGHGVCETHYGRLRSTGRTDLVPRVEAVISAGYRICKDANHPLAMANGWIAEHRRVAHTKYGVADLSCHWCNRALVWKTAVVDHLNERKDDNRPENLVVACNPCNRARGGMIPFIRGLSEDRLAEFIATLTFMRA